MVTIRHVGSVGGHKDKRRTISDIVLDNDLDFGFPVRQIKILKAKMIMVRSGRAVGNHYHSIASNRFETFIIVAPPKKKPRPIFKFLFRNPEEGVQERLLYPGDACDIPPGHTHTFVALVKGAELWGFSNTPYDDDDTVIDNLA